MFSSNNPGNQFWKQSLSNESPGFQCICPLPNRAIDTCLSHYSHVTPQEVLSNTSWTDQWLLDTETLRICPRKTPFSTRMNNQGQRSHNTRSTGALGVSHNLSCRTLEALGCREHSPHFPPVSIPPPAQPGTGLPAEKLSWLSHLLHLPQPIPRGIQKTNQANRFAGMFEPSNQSPEVTSLKKS